MKKPGFNNIDNVVVKRIKDSVLSDSEVVLGGGAFSGVIDPLVEERILVLEGKVEEVKQTIAPERIRKITIGQSEPDPLAMEDGEVYFQYE